MGTAATLLTIGEVAAHVDRPVRTVAWWAKNDRLPATKLGGRYVVDAADLPIAEDLAEHRGRRAETDTPTDDQVDEDDEIVDVAWTCPSPAEPQDDVDAEIRGVTDWVAEQRELAASR